MPLESVTIWQKFLEYLIAPGMVGLIVLAGQYFLLPLIEREKTREIAFIQHKKDIFVKTVQLLDQHLNAQQLSRLGFAGHVPLSHVPTTQINDILSQLSLLAVDKNIVTEFQNMVGGPTHGADLIVKRAAFILLLRNELYKKDFGLTAQEIGFWYNKS